RPTVTGPGVVELPEENAAAAVAVDTKPFDANGDRTSLQELGEIEPVVEISQNPLRKRGVGRGAGRNPPRKRGAGRAEMLGERLIVSDGVSTAGALAVAHGGG